MTEADANHVIELYKAIRTIDRLLEQVAQNHTLAVEVWATTATGNYPMKVEFPDRSPFRISVKAACEGQLRYERELRVSGLKRLGFDAPEAKAA